MPSKAAPHERTKTVARWSLWIVISIIAFFVVGVSTIQETYRDWQVDQEMQNIKTQIMQLEAKRSSLSDVVQKMNAFDNIDREARAQLGMQKPGERVIVLRGGLPSEDTAQEPGTDITGSGAESALSNPQKWFTYFFNHD